MSNSTKATSIKLLTIREAGKKHQNQEKNILKRDILSMD